jgi:beta-mannosidase
MNSIQNVKSLFVAIAACQIAFLCSAASHAAGANSTNASDRNISLSGDDWWIRADPHQNGKANRLFESDVSGPNWISASVPGNIQADLEAAHLLKPLWYGNGDPRLDDVARTDWWYRKDFVAPATLAKKRITLVFDGVDFECEVWLNGKQLGRNVGMFRQFQFDGTDILRPGQTNRLAVRLAKMPDELARFYSRAEENGVYNDVIWQGMNKTRQWFKDLKSPTNSGWDWGINIWTLGIWKDVRLVATGPARIDDIHVQTLLNADRTKATITAAIAVESSDSRSANIRFRVSGNGDDVTLTKDVALVKGRNAIQADLTLDKPALWWPNGQGAQSLYVLRTEIESNDKQTLSDACSTRFGVRDIRWELTENAPADSVSRYQLVINGRTVRTMGSNLIPPDLLFGRAEVRALPLLHRAKVAGMNMLRQWGGGVPLSNAFYDLADELGIMISVEFPLANVWPETDADFLGNLDSTTRNIIRQVRNHPAVIEYTGGNEMLWNSLTKHPALDVLRKAVADEDGRMFRAACPDVGARHGPHNFLISETYRHYNTVETMRYGEFGTSSPANLEVWQRDIPPKSQAAVSRFDDPVLVHKNVVQGAFGLQDWLYKPRIDAVFGKLDAMEPLVQAGQFLGAEQMRYAMDALRRKGKRIGGFTNWDFNEPWTNGAGSYMVDYDGRPLMVYDFVRQALAPISLSLRYDSVLYPLDKGIQAELFLTSDFSEAVSGLRWKWLARDRRGTILAKGDGQSSIEPLQTQRLAEIRVKPPKTTVYGPIFVELALRNADGRMLGERLYLFAVDGVKASMAGVLKNRQADVDDDTAGENIVIELPGGPQNLAFVGNGAKPATASSSRPEAAHQPPGLNDGHYGNASSWIANVPHAWFQIDLGKRAEVGRFTFGRDRFGEWNDRYLDSITIETSLDGKKWQKSFERSGLTALLPPNGEGTQSIVIDVTPIEARFVKVTVDPKEPNTGMYACIDEFEVQSPAKDATQDTPRIQLVDSRPEIFRPVRRTALAVSASSRMENGVELLDVAVENRGEMTALICEPHPLLEYRTDVSIDNNHCFVPPGESRTMTIKKLPCGRTSGKAETRVHRPTLAQTGWRISCWNADDVVLEPSTDVLLAAGRRDAMCREFCGYESPGKLPKDAKVTLVGKRPDATTLPFLLAGKSSAAFEIQVDAGHATQASRLCLHAADQAADVATAVEITVNGKRWSATLPKGLGIQRNEPSHLAFPATIELPLPRDTLVVGKNLLEVRVSNSGWFTWDAMSLIQERSSGR